MKITLNLSPRSSARDRYALGWGIPATLVGVAALVILSRASLREYREYRAAETQISQIQGRVDDLARQEADMRRKLAEPASRDLRTRARFLNELIAKRQVSLAEVSSRLAGLLPADARLSTLTFVSPKDSTGDYSVRIGITAKGEEAIETYMNDLEDSPDFKDISIENQTIKEDPSQGSQINVVCNARYLPGAEEQQEEKDKEEATKAGSDKAEGAKPGAVAKNHKPEAKKPGTKKPEVKMQKTAGNPPAPVIGPPKMEMKGAEKPTPNRKPDN
jgi:hypothetical protein